MPKIDEKKNECYHYVPAAAEWILALREVLMLFEKQSI